MKARSSPQSAAFRRWFAGSKAVTGDGEPMVLFHGTRSPIDFDAFETGNVRDELSGDLVLSCAGDPSTYMGPHFAEEYEVASRFAEGNAAKWDDLRYVAAVDGGHGGRVLPVYLSVKSVRYFPSDEAMYSWILKHGKSAYLHNEAWDMAQAGFFADELDDPSDPDSFDVEEFLRDHSNIRRVIRYLNERETDDGVCGAAPVYEELGASAKKVLLAEGYDAVKYKNSVEGGTSWIALKPGSVKSAVGNSGAWDPSSDSLTDPGRPRRRPPTRRARGTGGTSRSRRA